MSNDFLRSGQWDKMLQALFCSSPRALGYLSFPLHDTGEKKFQYIFCFHCLKQLQNVFSCITIRRKGRDVLLCVGRSEEAASALKRASGQNQGSCWQLQGREGQDQMVVPGRGDLLPGECFEKFVLCFFWFFHIHL